MAAPFLRVRDVAAAKVILALGLGQPRSAPKGLYGKGRSVRTEVTGAAHIL